MQMTFNLDGMWCIEAFYLLATYQLDEVICDHRSLGIQ